MPGYVLLTPPIPDNENDLVNRIIFTDTLNRNGKYEK